MTKSGKPEAGSTPNNARAKLRTAIYTRVSRDMRDTGRSVAEQEAECRTWVANEPAWKLVGKQVWCDNDLSASQYARKERPDWEELLDEIEAGHIDLLVIWEPARATRDRGVWATLAGLCEENNVRIGASGRVYDLQDPEDAFQLDLFFSLAARESRVTRKRVKRSQRSQAALGRPHGRLLYGYRREYNKLTGALDRQIPDTVPRTAFAWKCAERVVFIPIETYTRAGIILEVADRFLQSETCMAVAKDLNMRGIPTPRHGKHGWHGGTVKDMVINPGYLGLRVFNGAVVGDADWPAILSPEVHYSLVAKFSDPARRLSHDTAIVHPLSGLLRCGVCGTALRPFPVSGKISYTCTTPKKMDGDKGYHLGRRAYRLHAMVEGLIAQRLSQPDALESFARDDKEAAQLRRILDELATKRARLQEHYDLAAAGELSAMALAAVERRLLPEITTAERRARQVRLLPVLTDLIRPTPEQVAVAWRGLELSQQRDVIRALFTSIVVHRIGKGVYSDDLLQGIEVNWRSGPLPDDPAEDSEPPV